MQGLRASSKFFIILSLFLLVACRTEYPLHGMPIDQMHNDIKQGIAADSPRSRMNTAYHVPKNVSHALLPSVASTIPNELHHPEKRFDVSANKIPAKDFFMSLVEDTPYNMVVDSSVTGLITIHLKNVTIPETLRAIQDTYGYTFKRTPYGYEVFPLKLETRIFTVNYLDIKRKGSSIIDVTSGQISEQIGTTSTGSTSTGNSTTTGGTETTTSGSKVDTRTQASFWHDLELSLKQIVSNQNGRSIVVNRQSGVVIAHALPRELRQIGDYLDRIQSNMNRQVILEAKVLEVQLNDQYQAGIDWNAIGHVALGDGGVGQTSELSFANTDLNSFSSIFTLQVNGDFGTLINLLNTQGNIQVLSSPHISTVNNQKAVIKVGTDEFFVTGVTSTNVVSASGAAFPTENVNLTPFFSGVTLDVTPQISSAGDIILHIHPTVSDVQNQVKTITLGNNGGTSSNNNYVLPLAKSTIRESDSIVRAKSGQVIVIGGLMQNAVSEDVAGVPIFSRIPFLGTFFRRTQQLSNKIELVILLRPIMTDNKAWRNELIDKDHTMMNMRRGFSIGGLPDVFGNEAEQPVKHNYGPSSSNSKCNVKRAIN